MFLLDDLLLAPIKGITWVGEKLRDLADKELYDPDRIQEELVTLQAKLDMEEIGEEEYNAREKELLERLAEIQKREEGD
ncbi:MAG: gas vesicle protein GvpG [Nitrospirae bacterium]|nr:gas vesicle protein GvpG [Nitrospirota bacterium]